MIKIEKGAQFLKTWPMYLSQLNVDKSSEIVSAHEHNDTVAYLIKQPNDDK